MIRPDPATGRNARLAADAQEDGVLMSQLQGGDDRALNALMGRWQQPLVSFLYRSTGNHTDAVDLAQETFARLYESCQRYQARGRFSTWLFTIAANLARNHARWRARHPTEALQGDGGGEETTIEREIADPAAPTGAQQLAAKELAQAVSEAIQSLPPEMKTATLLYEYEDLSYQEIAEVEACSVKAVETRLYRARELLRRKLSKWRLTD